MVFMIPLQIFTDMNTYWFDYRPDYSFKEVIDVGFTCLTFMLVCLLTLQFLAKNKKNDEMPFSLKDYV